MRLVTSNPSIIKNAIESVGELITEGSFVLEKDAIRFRAMDPAGVSMVILTIFNSVFDVYEVNGESLTLNLEDFMKVLRRAKTTDKMELTLEENRLKITFKGNAIRSFSLPLIEPLGESQKVPELEFKCKVELDVEVLKDAMKDASMVSDAVTLELSGNTFLIRASGDSQEFSMELNKDTPGLISMEGEGRAKYSLDYLGKMMKASSLADSLIMRFSTDYPLQLEYKALDKIDLVFILAPRIESE
ncbi:MAG: proliferating cell nuclear antigen (pcna) [Nanoarchaeota archaeon]|nr:proliferating cell nuclear antigen (pcna) [Nanoarchaeota archaeon]